MAAVRLNQLTSAGKLNSRWDMELIFEANSNRILCFSVGANYALPEDSNACSVNGETSFEQSRDANLQHLA